MIDISKARLISRAIGRHPFGYESGDAKHNAQRNLSGISHFADPDTLRFFESRILSTRPEAEGLLFGLVESHRSPTHNGRSYRFVVFDLRGRIVTGDNEHSSSAKARQALETFLVGFDVLAHYRKAMAEDAEAMACRAALMAETVKEI